MTTESEHSEASAVPGPQGHVAGVPYDLRRPTWTRLKSRVWNAEDGRMFPPKSIGLGWAINFYWLFHLPSYFKGRSSRS